MHAHAEVLVPIPQPADRDPALPRVVAVGFNKCGTRSLARLFARAGHPVVHHKLRLSWPSRLRKPRRIGRLMRLNVDAGRPVFCGVEHYIFYGDLIDSSDQGRFDGNTLYRRILVDYPDTILLLNWRDREDWIRSRMRHGHGEFAARERRLRGLCSSEDLASAWRLEWDQHLAAVRAFMASRPQQLIEFRLDHDPIEALVQRLSAYGLRPEHFSDIGRSRDRQLPAPVAMAKRWWSHRRPRSQG
jgi:hypothetical protein